MFGVSVRGNYLFGYGLGQSPKKRELFAWANVAADVWKAFGLVAVSALWRDKRRRAASIASIAWFACLVFGINSALGVYVQDRVALVGSREATHATYRGAEAELAVVEAQLRTLAAHRGTGEVEAAINALLARPVTSGERLRGTIGSVSLTCTKIDARTQDVCAEISTLRQELAAATEAKHLEARTSVLRSQIIKLRERGGSIAADPVGEFYAWLNARFGERARCWLRLPASFRTPHRNRFRVRPDYNRRLRDATRRDSTGRVGSNPDMARHDRSRPSLTAIPGGETAAVLSWIAERAVPTNDNRAVGIEELHRDYTTWSSSKPMPLTRFQLEFDRARDLPDLAGKIRKFGDRYYGIALLAPHSRSTHG